MRLIQPVLLSALCSLLSAAGSVSAQAQNYTVSGTVLEKATGLGVPMAGVVVKNSTRGAIADLDGHYEISASPSDTLVCEMIGYNRVEIPVSWRAVIDFLLEEETEMLEQSIVVGYGTLKKTQLVGAVENVDGKSLNDRVNTSITRSLLGQVAGLNIIQTDGKPTHSGSVYIRGNSTSYHTRSSANDAQGST